jgi:hypothetical protein
MSQVRHFVRWDSLRLTAGCVAALCAGEPARESTSAPAVRLPQLSGRPTHLQTCAHAGILVNIQLQNLHLVTKVFGNLQQEQQ